MRGSRLVRGVVLGSVVALVAGCGSLGRGVPEGYWGINSSPRYSTESGEVEFESSFTTPAGDPVGAIMPGDDVRFSYESRHIWAPPVNPNQPCDDGNNQGDSLGFETVALRPVTAYETYPWIQTGTEVVEVIGGVFEDLAGLDCTGEALGHCPGGGQCAPYHQFSVQTHTGLIPGRETVRLPVGCYQLNLSPGVESETGDPYSAVFATLAIGVVDCSVRQQGTFQGTTRYEVGTHGCSFRWQELDGTISGFPGPTTFHVEGCLSSDGVHRNVLSGTFETTGPGGTTGTATGRLGNAGTGGDSSTFSLSFDAPPEELHPLNVDGSWNHTGGASPNTTYQIQGTVTEHE